MAPAGPVSSDGAKEKVAGQTGERRGASNRMQAWFRACSPAARVLRASPAVRCCGGTRSRRRPRTLRRTLARARHVPSGRTPCTWPRRATRDRTGQLSNRGLCAAYGRVPLLNRAQNRGLALANVPARSAVRSLAPLAAALPTTARAFSAGAPARDELERIETTTSELQHYGQWLADILPSMIDAVVVAKGELCIVVTPPAITHVMTFLRDHSNCQVCTRTVVFRCTIRRTRWRLPADTSSARRHQHAYFDSTRWYPM